VASLIQRRGTRRWERKVHSAGADTTGFNEKHRKGMLKGVQQKEDGLKVTTGQGSKRRERSWLLRKNIDEWGGGGTKETLGEDPR